MKKAKNIVTLILIGFTIYLCFRNYKLSREVNSLEQAVNEIPDTVYIKKPFKPEKKFSEEKEPDRILVYDKKKSDSLPDNSIRQHLISKQDSLVQFVLKRNQLNLSLLNKETNTYSTRLFQIDLDKYSYNWYEGQLTQKRVKRFSSLNPYIYGKYRPFNNLLDMGTGIEFKTNRFNYKLGINAFYYPKFQSGIGTDLEFSVQYKF